VAVLVPGLETVLLVLAGLSGGLITGTGLSAILNALGLPARLASLSSSRRANRLYELALAAGVWVAAFWLPFPFMLPAGEVLLAGAGLVAGAFVGMLASALAETIGVMPVVAAHSGAGRLIGKVIWALAAGKTVGSLLHLTFASFAAK
jgi:stage V sporulation protein AB